MLIFCDLATAVLVQSDKGLVQERVKGLIQSHQEGRHLVVFGRETYVWITKNLVFSSFEGSTLRRIGEAVTQTGNLPSIALCYIRIVGLNAGVTRVNSREIAVSLNYKYFSELLLRPIVVVEDIVSDIMIYNLIFTENSNCRIGHGISYDPAHGGGERLIATTKVHTNQHRIVCTIYDTDKKAPMHTPDKLGTLSDQFAEVDWPLLFPISLPCSEIENVIPLAVYCNLLYANNTETIEKLLLVDAAEEKAGVSPKDRFWLFFDVKNGFSDDLVGITASTEMHAWFEAKLRIFGNDLTKVKIAGLGRTAIKTLGEKDSFSADFRRSTRDNSWKDVFLQTVESIYWVVVAPSPRFVC